jgi:hypothetical protein
MRMAVATLKSQSDSQQGDVAQLSIVCQVNTATQKAIQKMERKVQKRSGKTSAPRVNEMDFVRSVGWAALQVRFRWFHCGSNVERLAFSIVRPMLKSTVCA